MLSASDAPTGAVDSSNDTDGISLNKDQVQAIVDLLTQIGGIRVTQQTDEQGKSIITFSSSSPAESLNINHHLNPSTRHRSGKHLQVPSGHDTDSGVSGSPPATTSSHRLHKPPNLNMPSSPSPNQQHNHHHHHHDHHHLESLHPPSRGRSNGTWEKDHHGHLTMNAMFRSLSPPGHLYPSGGDGPCEHGMRGGGSLNSLPQTPNKSPSPSQYHTHSPLDGGSRMVASTLKNSCPISMFPSVSVPCFRRYQHRDQDQTEEQTIRRKKMIQYQKMLDDQTSDKKKREEEELFKRKKEEEKWEKRIQEQQERIRIEFEKEEQKKREKESMMELKRQKVIQSLEQKKHLLKEAEKSRRKKKQPAVDTVSLLSLDGVILSEPEGDLDQLHLEQNRSSRTSSVIRRRRHTIMKSTSPDLKGEPSVDPMKRAQSMYEVHLDEEVNLPVVKKETKSIAVQTDYALLLQWLFDGRDLEQLMQRKSPSSAASNFQPSDPMRSHRAYEAGSSLSFHPGFGSQSGSTPGSGLTRATASPNVRGRVKTPLTPILKSSSRQRVGSTTTFHVPSSSSPPPPITNRSSRFTSSSAVTTAGGHRGRWNTDSGVSTSSGVGGRRPDRSSRSRGTNRTSAPSSTSNLSTPRKTAESGTESVGGDPTYDVVPLNDGDLDGVEEEEGGDDGRGTGDGDDRLMEEEEVDAEEVDMDENTHHRHQQDVNQNNDTSMAGDDGEGGHEPYLPPSRSRTHTPNYQAMEMQMKMEMEMEMDEDPGPEGDHYGNPHGIPDPDTDPDPDPSNDPEEGEEERVGFFLPDTTVGEGYHLSLTSSSGPSTPKSGYDHPSPPKRVHKVNPFPPSTAPASINSRNHPLPHKHRNSLPSVSVAPMLRPMKTHYEDHDGHGKGDHSNNPWVPQLPPIYGHHHHHRYHQDGRRDSDPVRAQSHEDLHLFRLPSADRSSSCFSYDPRM